MRRELAEIKFQFYPKPFPNIHLSNRASILDHKAAFRQKEFRRCAPKKNFEDWLIRLDGDDTRIGEKTCPRTYGKVVSNYLS